MAQDIEFVDGLIVKKPNEKAPDYVKASISIKVEDLGKYLRAKYKAGNEWLNIDVKESKNGKWYAALSTYKPKGKAGDSDKDDIPFSPIRKVEASIL